MNTLNSIILEGNLVATPKTENGVTDFQIVTSRFEKNAEGEGVEKHFVFDIRTFGKLGEFVENRAKIGQGLRIVGRLENETEGETIKTFTVAEHIEFKPFFVKENDLDSVAVND